MKKKLFFILALLLPLCGGRAWADESWSDVTSTYVTNATFTDYYSQSDNTAWPVYTTGRTGNTQHPKNWYLHTNGTTNHNVTAGTLFECWAANQAVKKWVLFQDITLPAGRYKLTGQYSTNESRGYIQTVAVTPHHTYTSEGITSSNWGSWGDQSVTFNLLKETKVRVGANCENFAQIHLFKLESAGAAGLLENLIDEATALSSTGLTSAISTATSVKDNASATDAEKVTAANTLSEAILAYRLAHASSTNTVDMTDLVKDPSFEGMEESTAYTGEKYDVSSWTYGTPSDQGARAATSATYLAYQNDGFYLFNIWGSSSMDIHQQISNLPRGKYQITAQYMSDASKTLTLYTGSKDNGASISSGTDKTTVVSGTSNATYVAKNGSLNIGAYSTDWYKVDNFKLFYLGYQLSDIPSTEYLTSPGSVEADDWYAFKIIGDGTYSITSSSAATVYYTQTGSTSYDASIATSATFTEGETKDLTLTGGVLYVKASAVTTLTLTAKSYSYVIGTATADVSYVQNGDKVTVSYASATTNDPDASLSITTTGLTFGGSDVTATATSNGFTFTVPDVTANTNYTLSIPAGCAKYGDNASSAAQEITFKTPAVFDQTCYIYSPKNKKFLSRGDAYGTAAMLDNYGIPVKLITDGNNKTKVQFVDNAKYLFGANWAWTDGDTPVEYTIEPFTSTTSSFVGYKFISGQGATNATLYISTSTANRLANNSADGSNVTDDDYQVFQIKTKDERDAIKTANILADHKDIATSAGNSDITTEAEFTAYLGTFSETVDCTSKVSGAALTTSLDDAWTATNVRKSNKEYSIDANGVECFQSAETFTQTVTGLVEGIYKVTLNGYFRQGSNANCVTYKDYDLSTAYLKANDYQINLKTWASDRSADDAPNGMGAAKTLFDGGSYLNTLYTYVGKDGQLALTICNPNYLADGWMMFENMTLTLYSDKYVAGQDLTSKITNPSFEDDAAVTNFSEDKLSAVTGWTINRWPSAQTSNLDLGVKETSNATYATKGSTGSYLLNIWDRGVATTQNIGVLPAGVYQLSADVCTGNSATSIGTIYLNANTAYSTGNVSSTTGIFKTEYLVFQSDGTTATTIGIRGGGDATIAANGKITKGAYVDEGYWWYKADNFKLTYVNDADATKLASTLSALVTSNAPYDDITDVSDYTTNYNTYKGYTSSNTVVELVKAINYLTNEYDDYLWQNASPTHPVDVTSTVIAGADCTSNDSWYILNGGGRTTESVTYYDGTTRTVFSQNHENGPARGQDVTVWYEGAYLLQSYVKNTADGSYNTIAIGDESTTIKGVTSGTNGWTTNDVYFGSGSTNQAKTITISLSNYKSANHPAYCGEMHLYYIGRNYTNTDANKYFGIYGTTPTIEVTDEKPVAYTTNASFPTTPTATFTNPNGLIYANSGQFASTQNIVAGTTCDLVLVDGHPFSAPTAFTAATAKYTMTAVAGDKFGTLVLPFAATTLPGKAYSLSGDVDMATGTVEGTEVTALTANEPVLVTAKGEYSGSSVTVAATSSTSTYSKGKLTGVYKATPAPEGCYVLQNHTETEGVAFYLVETTVAQPTVNPFRAYIPKQSSSVRSIRILFGDGEETGIEAVGNAESELNDAVIYDLSGRRVQKAGHGIYIINGKKVLK